MSLDPSKLWAIRYHYACCFFDTGIYRSLGGSYLPGEQNSNEDGTAKDVLGMEVKYRCMEAGCTLKRQVGKFGLLFLKTEVMLLLSLLLSLFIQTLV